MGANNVRAVPTHQFKAALLLIVVTCINPAHGRLSGLKQNDNVEPIQSKVPSDESAPSERSIVFDHKSSLRDNRKLIEVPSTFQGLDENFLRLSIQAGEVSKACNDADYSNRLFPRASRWINEPDGAMVTKIDGICFAAFRATTWTFSDWSQNLDPGFSGAVCNLLGGNNCCNTRRGFRDAFIDVSYFSEFEQSLEDCVESCVLDGDDGRRCKVVFTGTSQGGAVAQVAAVMKQQYNPTTITFGQPPTMQGECSGSAMDVNKLYRWVNTVIVDNELKYDPVPFLLEFGGVDHSGHMFVLGEDNANVAYYRDNDAPIVGTGGWTYRHILDAHNIDQHVDRIRAFLDSGNLPVAMNGFANGEKCIQNHECSSDICVGYCSDGGIGEDCDNNNDCQSNICGRGGRCTEGAVGDPCWREDDCSSRNTCEGIFDAVCQPKRNSGRGCNEDDDCLSGNCRWTFTCS